MKGQSGCCGGCVVTCFSQSPRPVLASPSKAESHLQVAAALTSLSTVLFPGVLCPAGVADCFPPGHVTLYYSKPNLILLISCLGTFPSPPHFCLVSPSSLALEASPASVYPVNVIKMLLTPVSQLFPGHRGISTITVHEWEPPGC